MRRWWMRHGRQRWGSRQELETWCGGSGIIRHKSGIRWPDDQEIGWCHVWSTSYTWRRREAWVFRFSLKTDGDGLSVVWHQNHCDSFLVWASKLGLMVWWFGPQNHRSGFLLWTSKPCRRRFIGLHIKTDEEMKKVWGHASTSDVLLHREASWARFS
jgi:hypothetical protein